MRGLFNEGESFSEHFLSKVKKLLIIFMVNENAKLKCFGMKSKAIPFFLIPVLITQEFFWKNPCST